jgi:hypothetical protein
MSTYRKDGSIHSRLTLEGSLFEGEGFNLQVRDLNLQVELSIYRKDVSIHSRLTGEGSQVAGEDVNLQE